MLNNTSEYHVYLAAGVTDLRKSIDGLSIIVSECFGLDPFDKSIFVFCNKSRDKIKILRWDDTGFWLYYKRLEKGIFKWPDMQNRDHIQIDDRSFRWLLDGLDIRQSQAHKKVIERNII